MNYQVHQEVKEDLAQQELNVMQFTNDQIQRYARQISLKKIGVKGQKKLLSSKVLIVGAGGLGSPIAIYLAALGIGNIGVVDNDKIEISNLHRQILFETQDIKKNKTLIASKKLKKLNPNIKIITFNKKLNKSNIKNTIKNFDIIVDGSDNFRTRFLLNDFCIKSKKF